MRKNNTANRRILPGVALLLIAALVTSGPATAAKKQDPPETTTDGLKLVKKTKSRVVYKADGAEFDKYTKVMIVECAVAFKENWQRDYNREVIDLSGKVRDSDVTRMKNKLSAEFKKVFTEVMTKSNHEVVTEAAADVLILRPAIINLVVNAPDLRTTGMTRTYVADSGQMTLYLELYDSVSSAKLAVIMDAEDAGRVAPTMGMSNRVTNIRDADMILKKWATELAGHLGAATTASTDN